MERLEGGPLSSIFNITEALDAVFDDLAAGDVIWYDGTSWGNFKNTSYDETKIQIGFNNLFDVVNAHPSQLGDGMYPRWNDVEQEWEPAGIVIADIPDIDLTSAEDGSILVATDVASMHTVEPPTEPSLFAYDAVPYWAQLLEVIKILSNSGGHARLIFGASGVGDFTYTYIGSGLSSYTKPSKLDLRTATTTGSRASALSDTQAFPFSLGSTDYLDWSKSILFSQMIRREGSDANVLTYLRLGESPVWGNIAAKGIGFKISGLDIALESYGTERAISATHTLSDNEKIQLVFQKTATSIRWWINGVEMDAINTSAAIPTGTSGTPSAFLMGIDNGAGVINAILNVCPPNFYVGI